MGRDPFQDDSYYWPESFVLGWDLNTSRLYLDLQLTTLHPDYRSPPKGIIGDFRLTVVTTPSLRLIGPGSNVVEPFWCDETKEFGDLAGIDEVVVEDDRIRLGAENLLFVLERDGVELELLETHADALKDFFD